MARRFMDLRDAIKNGSKMRHFCPFLGNVVLETEGSKIARRWQLEFELIPPQPPDENENSFQKSSIFEKWSFFVRGLR